MTEALTELQKAQCSNCDGQGTMYEPGSHEYPCPKCNGTGLAFPTLTGLSDAETTVALLELLPTGWHIRHWRQGDKWQVGEQEYADFFVRGEALILNDALAQALLAVGKEKPNDYTRTQ